MKKIRCFIGVVGYVALIGTLIGSGLLYSEEWTVYGPRAEGMGGAGVAMADGATAHYWNPGATSKNKKLGLYIPFGLTTSAEGDIIAAVDKVAAKGATIDWSAVLSGVNNGGTLPLNDVQTILNFFSLATTELNKPGQGLLLNGGGGASFAIGKVTVFFNGFGNMNIDPTMDNLNLSMNSSASAVTDTLASVPYPLLSPLVNTTLASNIASSSWWIAGAGNAAKQADQLVWAAEAGGADTSDPAIQQAIILMAQATAGGASSSGATVSNNKSGVIINGLIVTEMGISYSRPVLENLSVGANFKMLTGQTYYNYINYQALQSGEDTMKDVTKKENIKTTSAFGLDVGALYSLTENVRAGVVARNINTPKFAYAGGEDIALDPQIRAGLAMNVLGKAMVVAVDYDVTKNESALLDGYESQMFGAGVEFRIPILAWSFRAGTYKNLASKVGSSVYTAGVGIHILVLDVDLAGSVAPEKAQTEAGQSSSGGIPTRAGFSVAVSLRF